MTTNSTEAIKNFTDIYTRWARLKKERHLFPNEIEPNWMEMGLDEWVVKTLKGQIDREINRTC